METERCCSVAWVDEATRFFLVWMVFLGLGLALARGKHVAMSVFRPHMFCLPVAKREHHRLVLRRAATSGDPRFFLGTGSAPHTVAAKESACGCAGIFNSTVTLPCLAQVFDEEGALDRLESFVSRSGAAFYGLPVNTDTITLVKRPPEDKEFLEVEREPGNRICIFRPDTQLTWSVSAGLRSHDEAGGTRGHGY